ncbi:MAG: sialidase family protein [Planctomycetota bacterium]
MPRPPGSPAGANEHCGPWVHNGFQSIQVNVDTNGCNIVGDAANEPSIAIDPTNPNNIVIGWRQFDTVLSDFRQAGWGYSHDAGRTWTFPGVLEPGRFRSDPVLDSDAEGNLYYLSLVSDANLSFLYCDVRKSVDGGVSWRQPVYAYGGDKPWFAIDKTLGTGHGNLYAAWDQASCCGNRVFTRSTNGGGSFMPPIALPGEPIFGTVAVGPNGEVYISGVTAKVLKSLNARDAGAAPTFTFLGEADLGGTSRGWAGPNPGGLLGQSWIACDHSAGSSRGNVYVLASVRPDAGGDPLDVMFARSVDEGTSWSPPVRVNDDPRDNGAWQWFGTLAVAPNGRIDVVWNDTRNDPTATFSELYYSFSIDAGRTWARNVAVSLPFNHYLGYPQQDKLGDYYHMISDDLGASVAYAATFNGEQDVYFLRLALDCNNNGVPDIDDINAGGSSDSNHNSIPDECEPGACCDHSPGAGGLDPAGLCTDNVLPRDCEGTQLTWHMDETCADMVCLETTGACCELLKGDCSDDVFFWECHGAQRTWTKNTPCADVECDAPPGACCDRDTFGDCTITAYSECDCEKCEWTKLAACADVECLHNPIPAVSQWGLVILTLLLLTGAKVYFGRRQADAA